MTPLEEQLNAIKVCIENEYPEAEDHILHLLKMVRLRKALGVIPMDEKVKKAVTNFFKKS